MSKRPIRVLCVDDHAFLVAGLRARLEVEPDMEYVGRLATADNLVPEVKRTGADIVLLDVEMPGSDVFEAMDELIDRGFLPGNIDGYMQNVFRTETANIYGEQRQQQLLDSRIADNLWGYELFNPGDDRSRENQATRHQEMDHADYSDVGAHFDRAPSETLVGVLPIHGRVALVLAERVIRLLESTIG